MPGREVNRPDTWRVLTPEGDYLPERHASAEAARHWLRRHRGCRALAYQVVKFPGSLNPSSKATS